MFQFLSPVTALKDCYLCPKVNQLHLFRGHRIGNDRFCLSEEEGHHCIKVTRHKPGDEILVTDFKGEIWRAVLIAENPKNALCNLNGVYKTEIQNAGRICIAISLTQQSDRFEWFLEKAVETGANDIYPLVCQRTENKKEKSERWNKVMLAAAKQTLRAFLPEIHPLQSLNDFIQTNKIRQRFICHCETGTEGFLGDSYDPGQDVVVLIGPEGDFSSKEISDGISMGFQAKDLGPLRLRTETAGIVCCVILQTVKNLA
ncbi:MAG: 16S rRNA (uracil(1498)-N(3))-methyltransferase [Saprospiraceae bacterium]|nr:16S rRNA (uracil(1498)-N(3))-methyltransferase [Saprospiraceae bacterium]